MTSAHSVKPGMPSWHAYGMLAAPEDLLYYTPLQ